MKIKEKQVNEVKYKLTLSRNELVVLWLSLNEANLNDPQAEDEYDLIEKLKSHSSIQEASDAEKIGVKIYDKLEEIIKKRTIKWQ